MNEFSDKESEPYSSEQYPDLYDRICKRCISFSQKGTILLINGLYGRDYPLDSTVEYNWTEHEDDDLRRTLADSIITINHRDSYHIEFQMYPDTRIVMRVFEYSFHHAQKHQSDVEVLQFPEPMVLYLFEDGSASDQLHMTIDFGSQGTFDYRVPAFRYLRMSREELERRKLIVLIPFQLLRLRRAIAKERSPENLKALKVLVSNDIIGVINDNIAAGNLLPSEGQVLKQMTLWLYRRIYEGYAEMEKEGINTMVEDALILDVDIIIAEERKKAMAMAMEVAEKKVEKEIQKRETLLAENAAAISEKNAALKNMAAKLRSMGLSEAEILEASGMTAEQLRNLEQTVV